MSKTKQEIEKVFKNEVAPLSSLATQAYQNAVVTMDTVELSRLLVINPTSKIKKINKSFVDGDIVDATNTETLSAQGEKLNVIPFALKFSVYVYSVENDRKELIAVHPYTGKVPYESEIDGKPVIQVPAITAFMLMTKDIESGVSLPCVFTFKGSSYQAGKKLNTIMNVKNKMAGRAPWASVVSLFSVEKKNEKNEWFAMDVSQVKDRGSSDKELAAAEFWYSQFAGGKVVEEELSDEDATF